MECQTRKETFGQMSWHVRAIPHKKATNSKRNVRVPFSELFPQPNLAHVLGVWVVHSLLVVRDEGARKVERVSIHVQHALDVVDAHHVLQARVKTTKRSEMEMLTARK